MPTPFMSRKFLVALGTVALLVLNSVMGSVLNVQLVAEDQVQSIVYVAMSYVLGQGFADAFQKKQ